MAYDGFMKHLLTIHRINNKQNHKLINHFLDFLLESGTNMNKWWSLENQRPQIKLLNLKKKKKNADLWQ